VYEALSSVYEPLRRRGLSMSKEEDIKEREEEREEGVASEQL
jgi:hypothetical protein